MIEAVGLILNYRKMQPIAMGKELVEKFRAKGIAVFAPEKDALAIGIEAPFLDEKDCQNIQCALTLGGDVTILRAARFFAPLNIPILGINMGTMGFLTELN